MIKNNKEENQINWEEWNVRANKSTKRKKTIKLK